MNEVCDNLRIVAVELYLVCEALHTWRGEVGEIVDEHATPLKSLDVLGIHVNSHHVNHELIAHATRLLCILDQVPGKELDSMELRPCPHICEREVAIKAGPNPLGLLDYLPENCERVTR